MPKEVILNGFRIALPLTPEAVQRVDRVAKGLYVVHSKLPSLSAWGILSEAEFRELKLAVTELYTLALDLMEANRVGADRPSPTPRS